jgi:hypothetical protein
MKLYGKMNRSYRKEEPHDLYSTLTERSSDGKQTKRKNESLANASSYSVDKTEYVSLQLLE